MSKSNYELDNIVLADRSMDSSKKYNNPHPHLAANIISKLTFWWIKPLFSYGKNHGLEVKHLYNTRPSDVSESLGNRLEQNWMEELQTAEMNNRKPRLLTALKKTFISSFTYYGVWTFLLCVVLRVLQPYVLGLLIWHFDPRAKSSVSEAYIYATSVIMLTVLTVIISQHVTLGQMEIGMRMRVACSSLIYRKTLRLSHGSANPTTSGQIVNLLSNDVSKFDNLFIYLHYIWIMPIQGALIAFFIWKSVNIASLAGVLLITIQTIPVQGYMSKWTATLRLKIAKKTDERVCLMSEIIRGIQIIKMYAWEKPFEKLVSCARSHEIDVLKATSYLKGFTLASFVFTERTTLYFTIMAYVLSGNNISADKVFSMAQYFNILQATMAIFYPSAVTSAAEALVSIKRLEKFLLLKENIPSNHAPSSNEEKSIILKDVAASWTGTTIVSTLHNIDTHIKSGKLCALVGPVGSGKTSFLQLILGELKPRHGEVLVKGSISYASQESWLFAGTVRHNILFGQPYDNKKYQKVVTVCALLKDFEQLPCGDKTLVGDRGTALSGGQRARINLARAVYRDADIYLLDDPLAAVDTHVGKHLFDECINGYLKNKTRILVTHQVQYLNNCDYIIVLNHGQVENEGTIEDIRNYKIDSLKLLEKDTSEDKKLVKENSLDTTSDVLSNVNTMEDKEDDEPQETEELMAKGSVSRSVYWKYFRSGASIFVIISFVCSMVLGQIGSSGSDYWIAYWTKQEEMKLKTEAHILLERNFTTSELADESENKLRFTTKNSTFENNITNIIINDSLITKNIIVENLANNNTFNESNSLDVNTALWIYGTFIITSVVMTTTRNLLFYKTCMNASKNLHNLMFSCLLKAPMLFFNTNPFGRILNRFSKDIGAVDEVLPRTMIESIQIFAVMTGILIQVILINWWTIFPMFIMAFLYKKIRNVYLATAQNLKRLEGTTKSPVFSHLNSTFLGLTTIRSANAQNMLCKEFDTHQDLHTGAFSLLITASTAFGFALDTVTVTFVAVITYSFIILNDGNTYAGNVGLAISQILILCGMLQYGMCQTAETIAQMTSVERILQFTQLDEEGPFTSDPSNKPQIEWPFKGEITFNHVFLQYSNSDPPVLKDLNFIIQPAMKVGVVGRTGAGKSSIISALFRLSEFTGAIYIDGINIKEIGLHDLRNKISIIPQDPVLFSATLRDNLDPFHRYDDGILWSIMEEVQLKSAFASLDYRIDESGSNLSAGQRQLLCLARAIIENNKILILDEATANVDPATDTLIQNTIRQKFKNCTVLTIAHRLNTIIDCDRILLLDHGVVLEFDHPHVLLQNEQSYFYQLAKETGHRTMEQFKITSKEAYNNSIYNMSTDPMIQTIETDANSYSVE